MSEATPTPPVQPNRTETEDGSQATTASESGKGTGPLDSDGDAGAAAETGQRASFLYRHPEDRLIGGICSGLGEYVGMDPVLVRAIWVALTIGTAGAGLLAYASLWLLLPVGTAQGGQHAPPSVELSERNLGRAGVLLVAVGTLWLLANLGILSALLHAFLHVVGLLLWPALLIGAGLLLLKSQKSWRRRIAGARESMQSGGARAASGMSRGWFKDSLRRAKAAIPLKRSRNDRMVYGVCGALGKVFGIDANLVRLIWVAFAIGSVGTGVLLYVLVSLLLPEEPALTEPAYTTEPEEIPVIEGTVG